MDSPYILQPGWSIETDQVTTTTPRPVRAPDNQQTTTETSRPVRTRKGPDRFTPSKYQTPATAQGKFLPLRSILTSTPTPSGAVPTNPKTQAHPVSTTPLPRFPQRRTASELWNTSPIGESGSPKATSGRTKATEAVVDTGAPAVLGGNPLIPPVCESSGRTSCQRALEHTSTNPGITTVLPTDDTTRPTPNPLPTPARSAPIPPSTPTPAARGGPRPNYKPPAQLRAAAELLGTPTSPNPLDGLTKDELTARFLSLARLPGLLGKFPPHLYADLELAAERCALRYLAAPTAKHVLEFLALFKVGVIPSKLKGTQATDRLRAYPNVPWPEPKERVKTGGEGTGAQDAALKAERSVEKGKIRVATQIIEGQSKVAACTDEVLEKLRALHPEGKPFPFGDRDSGDGPPNGAVPKKEDIRRTIDQLAIDVAGGVSGATVQFLKIATRNDAVLTFITTLTAQMAAGTAPAREMLCIPRLIPLDKEDGKGGIRPIAVGELIYRVAMTSNVRKMGFRHMLGANQFGVNTRGGVEPLLRLIQRAKDHALGREYKWVTSLDAKNAFNLKSRESIAEAVKEYAPGLYRLAKWAYNHRTIIVVNGLETRLEEDEWVDVLFSSDGVRQGDPLAPLLFSIAMRVVLKELQAELGPGCIIIAYLDDVYILSTDFDPLPQTKAFFAANPHHLTLNRDKCESWPMEHVRNVGIPILGSFIGPKEGREKFLKEKIARLSAKLDLLPTLHSQHALLILRMSYQQRLRHLQRCLDTSDLGHVWAELDALLWKSVKRLRAAELSHPLEDEVISLPMRLGGMGILSHQEVAPEARAAADELADRTLQPLLDEIEGEGEGAGDEASAEEKEYRGQSERCLELFQARSERILAGMTDKERKAIVENGSVLGRKWLSAIPWNKTLKLNNQQISVALHSRTLIPVTTHCTRCGHRAELGHGETCNINNKYYRHNQIVWAIGKTLKTVRGVGVEYEPTATDESGRRNDLRVKASTDAGFTSGEYDMKVYSIFGDLFHKATNASMPRSSSQSSTPPSSQPIRDHVLAQAERSMRALAEKTARNAPGGIGKFTAIVMTSGGLVEQNTWKQMDEWKVGVKEWDWASLLREISIQLVKARAKVVSWG